MKARKTIYLLIYMFGFHKDRLLKLLLLGLFIPFSSFGQEYGLEFAGQPVSKDQRTQLDLTPDGYLSFRNDFELSFSIQLRDIEIATFGYIARIVDIDGNNIDLIFDSPESQSLHVVYGHSLTHISVPDNAPDIYDQWTELRLKYNIIEKTLQFDTPDTTILHRDVVFSRKVKIFFGSNDFSPVETADVPRMNIRDVRIFEKGICLHHFPLNEISGNEAKDIISNKNAIIRNPGWIMFRYHNWARSFETYLSGHAAICYDPVDEKVYLVGDEQMKIFSVLKDSIETIEYSSKFSDLFRGSQVFYDSISNRLISYNLKNNTISHFDFSERKWEKISDWPNRSEGFWFHNKFYSSSDSILYIFGGYGQHKYSKLVQNFDFKNAKWDTIQTYGELFHPRMHAALGNCADTLYILGGFGSRSGDQILKPEHYTDLLAFNLKESEFIKLYEFQAPMKGLDFAHSMVINKEDRSYYVLATTIFEYDTYLQLLKGNLASPKLIELGNKIPYLYHNENSYSDLFYSKSNQELIATTSLSDIEKNVTSIAVYKLSFPPYIADLKSDVNRSRSRKIVFTLVFLLVAVTMAIILVKTRKKKEYNSSLPKGGKKEDSPMTNMPSQNSLHLAKPKNPANSILFFGGFQVINKHGDDITKKFTPLLKELFLIIFLYSIKDKGISVPRLTELLWFSMDSKTAKNNRAVNIAKLKHLLSEIDSCSVNRNTSYWQVEFNDSIVYNDYWSCIKSINQERSLSTEGLMQFLCLINKGPLLGNASYEWLDEFKLECSNMIIDSLSHFVDQGEIGLDPELMIQLADAILIFDMMHEEAISIKCKSLTTLGKHSLAKDIFTKFSKDYFTLYDEPFDRSFTEIIKN